MLKITMKEDNEIFFFKSVDTLFACRKCTFIVSVTKKVTVIKNFFKSISHTSLEIDDNRMILVKLSKSILQLSNILLCIKSKNVILNK